jgi:hypothetical protein
MYEKQGEIVRSWYALRKEAASPDIAKVFDEVFASYPYSLIAITVLYLDR